MKKQKDEQLFALQKEAAVIQVNLGCTFSFLIFPNYIFQADLDHVDSVLRQLEKRPGARWGFYKNELCQAQVKIPDLNSV